jgi:transposase-like protein
LDYCYKAYEPGIKEQIVEMAINGSGIRDTARVLNINKNTVINTLKKRGYPCSNQPHVCHDEHRDPDGSKVGASLRSG